MLTLAFSAGAKANWNPFKMDHARFAHLSPSEKEIVLIQTMEMIVEMEEKFPLQTTAFVEREERFRKYVNVMLKLQSLILPEAHAQAITKLDGKNKPAELAQAFVNLLKNKDLFKDKDGESRLCIYGGYVSKTIRIGGNKKVCTHPGIIAKGKGDKNDTKLDLAIRAAYLAATNAAESKSGKCEGPEEISCNPVVFGFASKSKDGSVAPFCVKTQNPNPGLSHNVSYECMQKALANKETLKNLSALYLSDAKLKATFDEIHQYIFDSCVCGSTDMDQDYSSYMIPHRTCYGMINSLKDLDKNACNTLAAAPATAIADSWNNYFAKRQNFSTIKNEKQEEFDRDYGKLISQYKTKALCPNSDLTVGGNGPSVGSSGPQGPQGPQEDLEEGKEPLCKTTVTNDKEKKDKASIAVSFENTTEEPAISEIDPKEMDKSNPKLIPVTRTDADQKITLFYKLKNETVISCIADVKKIGDDTPDPNADAGGKFTISVQVKEPNDLEAEVTATIKKDSKPEKGIPEGYTVTWYKEGDGATATPVVKEKKSTMIMDKPAATPVEEPVDPKKKAAPEHKNSLKFTEIKSITGGFKVCAQLINDKTKAQESESCGTIDGKKEPTIPTQGHAIQGPAPRTFRMNMGIKAGKGQPSLMPGF